MASQKTTSPMARLSADLIVKKGQAAPISDQETVRIMSENMSTSLTQKRSPIHSFSEPQPFKNESKPLTAMTVKLDEARYKDLKIMGLMQKKTSQQILVEAFDLWVSQQK